ncbi:MAG: RecX family transcriptional regulator [Flavobacteriales bacterium]|nr:RecX family transcriptional regulator [Flavobacteriales bacterium]
MEYYCSYQERCHVEVEQKMYQLAIPKALHDKIFVHLIEHNFLNEERFAELFTISKFHQKSWGKNRIVNELKARHISTYLIQKSIQQLSDEEYHNTFLTLAEKTWTSLTEKNKLKKQKKFCDTLLRKGWEIELVFEQAKLYSI